MSSLNDLRSELDVKDDLYLVYGYNLLVLAESSLDALGKAFNMNTPYCIKRLGTDEKLDARTIAALWNALGWKKPILN